MPTPSSPPPEKSARPSPSRRQFLATGFRGLGAAALLSHLPKGWCAPEPASQAPEIAKVTFGFIALTDCSPIVIAHEKGFFRKYGIDAIIRKGANWAAIRDMLSSGETQASHMLLGMPLASTLGLQGSPKKTMVIPWLLNRNGQAITLKSELRGKVAGDPRALKPFVDSAKALGEPLSFAMTFPPGTHAMWMRYFLGAGGIHPDRDVNLITIPPPQMVANMRIGKMDGFCVGEPWNARAIGDRIGFTSVTTQDLWKDHPEKVCAFTEDFAARHPRTVKAVLKALHEASVWLDDFDHRSEQCDIVSKPNYIACPKHVLLPRLMGDLDYGDGRRVTDTHPMHFSLRNCNYPQAKHGLWWLSQFRRWGMVNGPIDYAGTVAKVMRGDLYEDAMKEIGHTHGGADRSAETLFDGSVFDPSGDPEAYAKSFAVNNLRSAATPS